MSRDTHGAFVRALLFGAGGAILGLALYAGFTIITGFFIGFVSLAVGWIVAKAMLLGSKGMGGRRYQIAAVLLTYAAVSMAAIPIALAQYAKDHKKTQHTETRQASPQATPAGGQEASSPDAASATPEQSAPAAPKPNLAAVFGTLAMLGLASPFLELQSGFSGVIGLVILFVGIRIAWRMTAGTRLSVSGPFDTPPQKA